MNRIMVAAVLVVSLTSAAWSVAAEPNAKSSDYYPLVAGSKWNYVMQVGDRSVRLTNLLAKIETIDGQKLGRIETLNNGEVAASEHISSTPEGVFRARFNGTEVTPPICLLKLPVQKGAKWNDTNKLGPTEIKSFCELDEEAIEVPAGKFNTVRVKVIADLGEQKVESTYWFVAGTGVVKQSVTAGGQTFYLELESFEPGK